MEVHSGAEIHLQPMEDPTPEQVDVQGRVCCCRKPMLEQAPGGTCGHVERGAQAATALLAGLTMRDPLGSSLLLKDCTRWKGFTMKQFVKNCSPWEGLTLEKFMEDCPPWEGPWGSPWSRGRV
ncbi:hypothetical protein BTVI_156065 [Pitangus sulphuratus]|nr:hypothetical protein BTVI_156065 [Pitangus sulphuratus]